MTATPAVIEAARTAALAAHAKLGTDIVALDVSDQLIITDVFLLASAGNERQVNAVVDAVEEALLKAHQLKPRRREGKGESQWVLLDFGDIVVHVFNIEDRQFYGLDALWKDCPLIDLQLPADGAEAAEPGGVPANPASTSGPTASTGPVGTPGPISSTSGPAASTATDA